MTYAMSNKSRRRRLTDEEKERIIDLREEGRSYDEMSRLMGGLPLSTIERCIKGIRRQPRVTIQPVPPREEAAAGPTKAQAVEAPPPNEPLVPDWFYDLRDVLTRDYESPQEMLDAVLRVLPPMSEARKWFWTVLVFNTWEMMKRKEDTTTMIRYMQDLLLLDYTERYYPEQMPQVTGSWFATTRIMEKLDEMASRIDSIPREVARALKNQKYDETGTTAGP